MDVGVQRHVDRYSAELDRTVTAVAWGVGIAFEPKNAHKWQRLRARQTGQKVGLTGAALESAVMGLAAYDPTLVKITTAAEAAGA